jgi:hypothetical protein
MKRIISILTVVLVMAFAFNAMAVDQSVTWTNRTYSKGDKRWVEITATCVAAANASWATTALYENESAETNGEPFNAAGLYLHSISTYFGGTDPPTDNTDMTLLEGSASGKDILVGAGTNMIDIATNNFFTTLIGTIPHPVPCFGTLYLAIANNAVNNAQFVIVFKFVS